MNKKAAMEMSVGTLVTIVLLMAVLGLGIFLIRDIFIGSSDAVESINNQVINEINNIFAGGESKLAVFPNDRSITLKKDDTPKGFAFSIKNSDVETAAFNYKVLAEDISACGTGFSKAEADGYILGGTGSFSLARGASMDLPELIKFTIPENAPPCTIIYRLNIDKDTEPYTSTRVFVTIK